MKARVIKAMRNSFTCRAPDGAVFTCLSRGKLRGDGVFVGDWVEIDTEGLVIESVCPRENILVRPPVANISQIVIVAAVSPMPDFRLFDKILLNAFKSGIRTVFCINKNDLGGSEELLARVREDYGGITDEIISISTKDGTNIEALRAALCGEETVTCFAGQSAAGKTSIINSLLPFLSLKTGDLSAKIDRGKNTTRHTELYELAEGGFVVDTAGFSLLDIAEMFPDELKLYYPEFLPLQNDCRFDSCNHIGEPHCAVAAAAQEGSIPAGRLERYRQLFSELKELQKNKYK